MSINSGFATQNLELLYNQTVCKLLHLCQITLLSLLKNEDIDFISFSETFPSLFLKLKDLEHQKSLEPKFSLFCTDLAEFFNCSKKTLPLKIVVPKSSKNFDLLLVNETFPQEISAQVPYKDFNQFSYVRSSSSQKIRANPRSSNVVIFDKQRPNSKFHRPSSSSSSRKSLVRRNKERVIPARYYRDRALELIQEGIDKSHEGKYLYS